jgi:hypothetical protein
MQYLAGLNYKIVFEAHHDALLSFLMRAHAYGVRTSFLTYFPFFFIFAFGQK